MFQKDYDLYSGKLSTLRTIGFFKKLISFGIWNNDEEIKKYENLCKSTLDDIKKGNELLSEAHELDKINDIIIIENIRISRNTFADLPTIGVADYPLDWEQLRTTILERDNYECQEADGFCKSPLQIHHKIPLSRGGNNIEDNLITLCIFHHNMKHPHLQGRS